MGGFSFLFSGEKTKARQADTSQSPLILEEAKTLDQEEISQEVIAVIAAAAYTMLTAEKQGISFKINRISSIWAITGRQKLMDSRQIF